MPFREVLAGSPPTGDSPNSGRIKWNENDQELFGRVETLETTGGPAGPAGPAGADGRTILNGTGVPASGLGVDGDFYIDTAADAIYGPKTAGAWGSATSLIGPQGPAGTGGASLPFADNVPHFADEADATKLLRIDVGNVATGTTRVLTMPDANVNLATDFLQSANLGVTVASLAGGVIPNSQLPPLAISDTFPVASEAAMLALTAQVGDVAVRTDLNKSFILRVSPATTLANWQELLTPTDAVASVQGRTGVVALDDILQARSERGAANGYATLGSDGKVPSGQLPASGATAARVAILEPSGTTVLTGATAGYVKVPFNTVLSDTHSMAVTANNRILPNLAGWYDVGGTVNFAGTIVAGERYQIAVFKNGALVKMIDSDQAAVNAATMVAGSIPVYCNGTTDYLEIFAQTSAGSNPSVTGASSFKVTFMGT